MLLEEIYQKTLNIEKEFKKKKVLFIPTESYDDPCITIIEGLNKLGFEILVYKKFNINSWFCNKIITNLENIEEKIDFVLSNIHWGTRWSLYNKLKHKVPYILIDGEDRLHEWSKHPKWKRSSYIDTIEYREKKYIRNPPLRIREFKLSPIRWVEDLGKYKPDIVFKSQKYKINKDCIYLPYGIKDFYLKYNINKSIKDREIDILHLDSKCMGKYRSDTIDYLNNYKKKTKFNIINGLVYGDTICDKRIKKLIDNDKNIHSWHRWRCCDEYFKTINNSKLLIYPSVDKYNAPGWDSKRPWETFSQNSLIIYQKQEDFDNSEYPIDELIGEFRYKLDDYEDLKKKIELHLSDLDLLEEKRINICKNINKYFNSITITRYFLWNIKVLI